jgi:hypothetical protein
MVEMALVACLLSACVNGTRDGKNSESELARKDGQQWSMLGTLRARICENGQSSCVSVWVVWSQC